MLNTLQPLSKPKPVKAIKAKKRKRKTNRQLLERQADSLVREIVLKRDRFCVCPAPKNGHTDVLQNGHLITRGRGSVKYDLRNCNAQCSGCNARHEHFAEIYTSWFIREFSVETYQTLVENSEDVKKLSVEELQILCNELTAIGARQDIDRNFKPRFSQSEILSGNWRTYNATRKENTMPELSERIDLGHKGAG
jgi:hypothetical protein